MGGVFGLLLLANGALGGPFLDGIWELQRGYRFNFGCNRFLMGGSWVSGTLLGI